jgi:hypothetical protein
MSEIEDRTGELPAESGTPQTQNSTIGELKMDETTKVILDQTYVGVHKRLEQIAERFNDGSAFVAQESKQGFLLAKGLMQATAQNLLEKEGLADSLMQIKSAGTFPNNLPSGGGVVVVPTNGGTSS